MGLLPALDIGRSGLLAAEMGLNVAGNNIANVNTPGYSRQRVVQGAIEPYADGTGVLVGRGVRIRSVEQIVDPLLDRRLRSLISDQRQAATRSDQLERLAGVLSDLGEPSLAEAVGAFFDAADALGRNPNGGPERETLLGAARSVATELNRRNVALGQLQRGADERLVSLVREGNDALQRIADLNVSIADAESTGQSANSLRDERERALRDLAQTLGVSVTEYPNGSVRVAAENGLVLVDAGVVTRQLTTQTSGNGIDGLPLHQVGVADANGGFMALPGMFQRGEIAALLGVRDGDIPKAQANLDTLAASLASAVNAVQQHAAAVDQDGNPTAAVPFFTGTTAGTIAVVITDPRRIAAARSAQPGDNQNALAFADLRTTAQAALGNTTFQGWLATEQSRLGQDAAQAKAVARASTLLAEQVQAQRDAVSGVNLNEELTNLLKAQRAFQAAARVISVADNVLGELMGLVR
ncbi:MAG: flagellar hook-associated protein FlgK [bacterium]|nr:flagellar hook-associated protein FlgK [bacterium]